MTPATPSTAGQLYRQNKQGMAIPVARKDTGGLGCWLQPCSTMSKACKEAILAASNDEVLGLDRPQPVDPWKIWMTNKI